ncbi:hypothetical protein DL89DRAFT_293117 [Linderina pennispora]|uniref:Uncharacterized protein n=1 Tax=Linderina pennispora TaxID=61395 RepID=A0A1Y1W7W3_9FUNG|nr:uncharacterized protein DL89DRAFT_293117 [Linderina pennispora]ORX69475.1 hypothetical protein DL89DRAFT_293117 [Linderina pennispora]
MIPRVTRPLQRQLPRVALQPRRWMSTEQRGRERIRFPWIWPSDADTMPKHSPLSTTQTRFQFITPLIKWFTQLSARSMTKLAFPENYIKDIQEKMAAVVLQRTVEAINQGDYKVLDELMTPFLAKTYKHAIANMKAQGYRLEIDVRDVRFPEIEDMTVFLGPPEAFDLAIPHGLRRQKYVFKFSGSIRLAVERTVAPDGTPIPNTRPPVPALMEWVQMRYLFKMTADVSVKLSLKGKVVDSDQGTMVIPMALSTPFYEGTKMLESAVKEGDESAGEPFRWRVSDLLNIVEFNERQQIAKAQQAQHDSEE